MEKAESLNLNLEERALEEIKLYRALMAKDPVAINERIADFNEKIKEAYPDVAERTRYEMYHIFCGSTYVRDKCPYWDFPGELSVEKFLEELAKEEKIAKE